MSRGRSRRARAADDGRAEAASVAQRIAVMLQAGVAADTAWNHAAQGSAAATKIVERIRAARRPGSGAIVEAVATQGPAWREFAAAWQVAAAVGAPLADTLRAFACALARRRRDDRRCARCPGRAIVDRTADALAPGRGSAPGCIPGL